MVKYTHKTQGGITREEIIDRNNSSSYGGGAGDGRLRLTGRNKRTGNRGHPERPGNPGTGGDKIKLVYWSNQRHDMEYVQKKIDEFNFTNDKNIEVSYEVMTENYDNNLELSFQGI